MKNVLTGLFLLILATACSEEEPQTITPVPFNQVTLTDGFWKNRMQTEINVTVPFSVEQSSGVVPLSWQETLPLFLKLIVL